MTLEDVGLESEPHNGWQLEPPAESVHATPRDAGSFCAVALKTIAGPPATAKAALLVMGTATGNGGVTLMVVAPLRVLSATEVAVNVTVFGDGGVFGAS